MALFWYRNTRILLTKLLGILGTLILYSNLLTVKMCPEKVIVMTESQKRFLRALTLDCNRISKDTIIELRRC